jgi:RNA polymerase sigma-70 factor (ECF subfamily)
MEGLSSSFLANWPGSSGFRSSRARLQAMLEEAVARGRATWPALALDAEKFVAYLAARLGADEDPEAALDRLHAGDLYLAFGCKEGDAAALAAFEQSQLADLSVLGRIDRSPPFIDEVRQRLRVHLFVGDAPKIAEYSGRGPLASWVRVVALRLGRMLRRSTWREVSSSESDEDELLAGADPELAFIKQRYRGEFIAAVREAVRTLDSRDRTLLRLNLVDRLNIEKIGVIYGVHRATVATWIASARKSILTSTRTLLAAKLQISRDELESLMGVVMSQIDVSLNRLLSSGS